MKPANNTSLSHVLIAGCLMLTGCSTAFSKHTGFGSTGADRTMSGQALAFQADEQFGSSLSRSEKGELTAAELRALQFGQPDRPVKWGEAESGVSGSVVVTLPFRVGQSSCRGFTHRLTKGDKTQKANGTACRRDGGPWKLVR